MSETEQTVTPGEMRRALFATLLGVGLGILVRVFSRRTTHVKESRAWRGRSEI
ncbi:MAG TPA: hypothetical protein VM600_02000 [Actinomycetota bacterium]|nr:hypothetical protein [Actinomycetota bacterium]